jgi:hypothetical protein
VPDARHERELAMLRAEVETLRLQRRGLLRATGAAAVFVARLDSHTLPESTFDAVDVLAGALDALPEETLRDAIELIRREAGGNLSRADEDHGDD